MTTTMPLFPIVPTPSPVSISVLSNHSVFHTGCYALCKALSYAPASPLLSPGNPALSAYILRSDYGLHYCSLSSAPTPAPSLSDFVPLYRYRKGLFPSEFLAHNRTITFFSISVIPAIPSFPICPYHRLVSGVSLLFQPARLSLTVPLSPVPVPCRNNAPNAPNPILFPAIFQSYHSAP